MENEEYLHVAVVQMVPATGDPKANVRRATELVRSAVQDHGAEVIVPAGMHFDRVHVLGNK